MKLNYTGYHNFNPQLLLNVILKRLNDTDWKKLNCQSQKQPVIKRTKSTTFFKETKIVMGKKQTKVPLRYHGRRYCVIMDVKIEWLTVRQRRDFHVL